MERVTWKGRILPGKKQAYIDRHAKIWPEMSELLHRAGVRNYTIWCTGDELFGYYEAEHGADYAAKLQAESPLVDKWNESMADIMVMEVDSRTGLGGGMQQVFLHE